jgi:hypothetical protein
MFSVLGFLCLNHTHRKPKTLDLILELLAMKVRFHTYFCHISQVILELINEPILLQEYQIQKNSHCWLRKRKKRKRRERKLQP